MNEFMASMVRTERDPEPTYAEVPPVGIVVVEDGEVVADVVESHTQWAACWCEDGRHLVDRDPWESGPRPTRRPSGSHWAEVTWHGTLRSAA